MTTNKDLLNSFFITFCKPFMTAERYRELIAENIDDATTVSHKTLHNKLMQLKREIQRGAIK